MARHGSPSKVESLALPERVEDAVEGWRNQGYHPFPSETTRQLLRHWFEREHGAGGQFHPAQRTAIETIIYLHEIEQCRSLRQVYEKFAPERLNLFKSIRDEVDSISFPKYCIKAATGSGKTWVLAALVVWQYFNAVNGEANAPYSARFMVVTPGREVHARILDSFLGRRDPKTGNRNREDLDLRKPLFMPDAAEWRDRFDVAVLEPDDVRSNTSPPDGPFVAVTNWQQFAMAKDKLSLAEELGLSIPEEPQGEIVADFMTAYPDLVVMNDEAHHVHGKKTAKAEELVWRKFMTVLDRRMRERHGKQRGLFLQLDFSATPFYGSGPNRDEVGGVHELHRPLTGSGLGQPGFEPVPQEVRLPGGVLGQGPLGRDEGDGHGRHPPPPQPQPLPQEPPDLGRFTSPPPHPRQPLDPVARLGHSRRGAVPERYLQRRLEHRQPPARPGRCLVGQPPHGRHAPRLVPVQHPLDRRPGQAGQFGDPPVPLPNSIYTSPGTR